MTNDTDADRREAELRRERDAAREEAAKLYRELQEACAEIARKNRERDSE